MTIVKKLINPTKQTENQKFNQIEIKKSEIKSKFLRIFQLV